MEALLIVGALVLALGGSWWLAARGERDRRAFEREQAALWRAVWDAHRDRLLARFSVKGR